jgi:hypothetical protein
VPVAIAITLILFFFIGQRVWTIFNTLNNGVETPGTVSNITVNRSVTYIDFTYVYRGRQYVSGNFVRLRGRSNLVKNGDRVTLILDPNNPLRAFIPDLYC